MELQKAKGLPDVAFNQAPQAVLTVDDSLDVSGWAVDPVAKDTGLAVEVAVDGIPLTTNDHIVRVDVASAFGRPGYRWSGFAISVPARQIGRGEHNFTVRVIMGSGKEYLESAANRFVVR